MKSSTAKPAPPAPLPARPSSPYWFSRQITPRIKNAAEVAAVIAIALVIAIGWLLSIALACIHP